MCLLCPSVQPGSCSRALRRHGCLFAQFSVVIAAPLAALLYKGMVRCALLLLVL